MRRGAKEKMRLLPPTGARGRSWGVGRRLRSWVALWLQERRRGRLAGVGGPVGSLAEGLVEHFGFEEANGARVGDVDGYVLAPVGTGLGSCGGIVGSGLALDGSDYLLGTEETSAFSPTVDGLTISIWVNFAGIANPYDVAYIVAVWDDVDWPGGSSWQIYSIPADGTVEVQVMGTGFSYLGGSTNLEAWTHICLVHDAAEVLWRLYLNGVEAMSVELDGALVTGRLGVGMHTNPAVDPAAGKVDELAIWSRPLEAAEVALLYNDGLGLAYPY